MTDSVDPLVVFVCRHGAARSVLAAELARRLAAERGVPLRALARGIEPDAEVSPNVALALGGQSSSGTLEPPQGLVAPDVAAAAVVISFNLDAPELPPSRRQLAWDDVPAISEDPVGARRVMDGHLRELLDDPTWQPRGKARER